MIDDLLFVIVPAIGGVITAIIAIVLSTIVTTDLILCLYAILLITVASIISKKILEKRK